MFVYVPGTKPESVRNKIIDLETVVFWPDVLKTLQIWSRQGKEMIYPRYIDSRFRRSQFENNGKMKNA